MQGAGVERQGTGTTDYPTATLILQDFQEYLKCIVSECKKNGGKIRIHDFAKRCFEYGRRYEVHSILEQAGISDQ